MLAYTPGIDLCENAWKILVILGLVAVLVALKDPVG